MILSQALGIGALVIAGCRSAAPASASTPPPGLTMLAQPHPVAAVQDLISQQLSVAAKEVGTRLSTQSAPLDDLRARLDRAVAAGQAPDLALVGDGDSTLLATRGLVVDAREALDRIVGLNGELFPPLRSLATAGAFVDQPAHQPAPVWAIPYYSIGSAWLVRQDLLAQKGLPLPSSFDDVRTAATKLTGQSDGAFGWGAALPVADAVDNLTRTALLAYGTPLLDPLGLTVALSLDAAATALQAIASLYRQDDGSPLAPTGSSDWSPQQVKAALGAGQVAQTIDQGGLYGELVAEQPSLQNALVALAPPPGPKGWYTSAASAYLVVLRPARAMDRVIALVERLLHPDRYDALTRAGRGSVIPPYAYLTKSPFWDEDPNYSVFAANARGDPARSFTFAALGFPAPPTPPAAAIQTAHVLANAIRSVVAGEASATAAATTARDQSAKLAQGTIAAQPSPTPTDVPFWLRLVGTSPMAK